MHHTLVTQTQYSMPYNTLQSFDANRVFTYDKYNKNTDNQNNIFKANCGKK